MSSEKSKHKRRPDRQAGAKSATPDPAPPVKSAPVPEPPAGPVAPLFQPMDWLAFAVTSVVVMIGYWFTLAPDLTLEDSGELAVGSMYAGIPHPPGYPVWTLYTWLFTKLVPFSNIAWRVALSSAVAGALSCGLIAMMVSRGSAMILEGFEQFKDIPKKVEQGICIVAGYVGGMLMGFNGFMWSQAVIVEVYTLSVLSLVAQLITLMRWMHAPHQFRYLWWSFFFGGISFTNHQTLIVAMIGIEIAILARKAVVGRDLFLINSFFFLFGMTLHRSKSEGLGGFTSNPIMFNAFIVIGLCCIAIAVWLSIVTQMKFDGVSMGKSAFCYVAWGLGALFYLYMPLAGMSNPPMQWGYPRTMEGFIHAFTRGQYEKANPTSGMDRFFGQLQTYTEGAIEEFNLVYLLIGLVPLVVLFYRRIERGEKMALGIVSSVFGFLCLLVLAKNFGANRAIVPGMVCGYVFLLMGVIPFLFFQHAGGRLERAWLAGLCTIYLFLALLLIFLLNPQPDRQSQQLNRVFFTASYVPVSMGIGYGLALIAAAAAAAYGFWRRYLLLGAGVAAAVAVFALAVLEGNDAVRNFNAYFGLGLAAIAIGLFVAFRTHLPSRLLLGLFCLFPCYTYMSHWSDNEQRGHLFGYWFGHDMFTPPFKDAKGQALYPEMARDAVLFGGTDPGRFCPTYMIFCESFIKPHQRLDPAFDRRDVYIITQNALADATYLMYIRAHYNRSTQIDPPFFQEWLRTPDEKARGVSTSLKARLVRPLDTLFLGLGDRIEKTRRVGESYFEAEHFTDLAKLAGILKAAADPLSKHLREQLGERTLKYLNEGEPGRGLARALAYDLNRQVLDKRELFTPERFAQVKLSRKLHRFLAENPQSHTRVRLNRLLLEEAYPGLIAGSPGGLYPDLEIHTPSVEDSQKSFSEYIEDAQRRLKHDMEKPNEPKQIRQGENVQYDTNSGRVSVSGQVAVMAINGLLTKVIFDKNPEHEFYVEESFPLDWMYPYLTPFGIIMKINRQPIAEMTQEMVDRDHSFWSQYSDRLIGNWINYDTSVADICKFVDKVFIGRDFTGFTGDRKFIRDQNGQKAFSKLRSAIAGMYFWRINHAGAMRNAAEQQRMIKECDFAFKQAFAYCPFSPEAVFRYTNLLISLQRLGDALLIAQTFKKLDPNNPSADQLVAQLSALVATHGAGGGAPAGAANTVNAQLGQLEAQHQANPANGALGRQLVDSYLSVGRTNEALAALDRMLGSPAADSTALLLLVDRYQRLQQTAKRQLALQRLLPVAGNILSQATSDVPSLELAAQAFNFAGNVPLLAQCMRRLAGLKPGSAETWFDLAGVQAVLGQTNESLVALQAAVRLSDQRLAQNPGAQNLRTLVANDGRFVALRPMPGFQQLTGAPPITLPAPLAK